MPTFVYDESAASNSGVFLLDIPDITWFKDSVLTALAEMTVSENWRGDTEDYRQYALLQANLMMATYKVLNFNPFPVGLMLPFASSDIPPGYLICDGSIYSTTEYPELFGVIGYTYGGEESSFAVPDMIRRVPKGWADGDELAEIGGHNTIALSADQLPSHTHEDYGHSHSIPLTTEALAVAPGELPVVVPIPILTASTGTGYANLANTGAGDYIDITNPYVLVPYVIYAGR